MFHPTRLVELRPPNSSSGLDLRITYQVPPECPYMTLSHTWGTARFIKLTKSTSQSLQYGFQSKDLPKTFRDAIEIARKFGINYLWIDSLCILQDSADDWTHEAARMGDVYYNSLCNIAATGASDSGQGCFFDRDRSLITPCTVKSKWKNKIDHEYHVIEALFWQEQMVSAPLNRRAWVVQERLLSPRVLHYGKDQLLWECHELDACETYPHGLPSIPANAHTLFKGLDPEVDGRRLRKASNNEPDPDLDPYHLWAKIVQAYTSSDLSKPGDKLIALSGIAKRFRSMLNDTYIAGLWLRVLPTQLLWHVDDCKQANGLPARKPTSYRAPSWSWASVDGEVSTSDINRDGILITVINTHVKPLTDDETGQIEDGYIVLQGKLFPAGLYRCATVDELRLRINTKELGVGCLVYPDTEPDDITAIFCCLPIREYMYNQKPWVWGLILEAGELSRGFYRRFGVFAAHGQEACEFLKDSNVVEDTSHLYVDGDPHKLFVI